MNAAPELWFSALKMIASLAAVLGGLGIAVALARRYLRRAAGPGGERLIRVLAAHPLGVKKSVALVEVPGSVLVLGVSGERIQLLSRIDAPELLARLERQAPAAPGSFYAHLTELTARLKRVGHA
jgi:flagellar biosynthetic protein FliO